MYAVAVNLNRALDLSALGWSQAGEEVRSACLNKSDLTASMELSRELEAEGILGHLLPSVVGGDNNLVASLVTRWSDHLGIARSVVVDLKSQELMNRLHRVGICTDHTNLAPGGCRLEDVGDFAALELHHRNAWRYRVMDEHRHLKIAVVEHFGDVRQVRSYFVTSVCVVCIVGDHFDCAAIGKETKMVGGLPMRKTHCVVAASVDSRRVLVRCLLMLFMRGARSCALAVG